MLSQIHKRGGRAFEKMLREKGVDAFTGAQGKILYVLWENGSMPISRICEMTSLANTTLTGMLDYMERLGLVTRAMNPDNRRQIIVSLSPLAEGLRDEYEDVSRQTLDIFYDGFSVDEITAFENMLNRILENYRKRGY